jgi:3-hydroxybutyryl-CoA dehydrogenase
MVEIETVGVVGCGLLGHGIAQVAAQAGYAVVVRELDEATLAAGLGRIDRQLARSVAKGAMEREQADEVRARIRGGTEYEVLAGCDLVIEAITEDRALKRAMWAEVDRVVGPGAVFATNTSSLSVIEQAAVTSRPERFVGLHFFNPAQVMRLVEVVRCVSSGDEAVACATEFGQRLGKLTVQARDQAGFIVNRLLIPYLLDAIRGYEEGIGSIVEIDEAMKAGAAYPMGPLTLCDFIGLDTLGSICEVLFDEFRERRFAAPPTLRKLLAAGWYGRKSGRGFYDYSGDTPVPNPGLI